MQCMLVIRYNLSAWRELILMSACYIFVYIICSIFNALFLVYAIIQITEINNSTSLSSTPGLSHIPVSVLTAAIPVVIAVAEVIYIGLAWKIYHEFGWKVYKFLGADRRIKKMYAQYQVYQCLVKFDIFFWVGFSVQFIWLVLNPDDWEYYVTCAAFPLSVVLLVEGHLAARHENKWMMGTFMSGCAGGLIYFVYKVNCLGYFHSFHWTLISTGYLARPCYHVCHRFQQPYKARAIPTCP